jgi:hypothetical protein
MITERTWQDRGMRYGIADELAEIIIAEEVANKNHLLTNISDCANDSAFASHDHDWQQRYAILSSTEISMNNLAIILAALKDSHPSIRRLAVVYLGDLKESIVFPYLFKCLKDPAISVRRTAGDIISDLGDPIAIPYMIEALQEHHKLMRWRAARYLFEVGDERALQSLRTACDDDEFEVRLQAKIAYDRIATGQSAAGTIWQQITNSSKNVQ